MNVALFLVEFRNLISFLKLKTVGTFPTLAMMATSTVLYYVSVPTEVEACLQNFAGGLILAAGIVRDVMT